jgi:hypothetical protein
MSNTVKISRAGWYTLLTGQANGWYGEQDYANAGTSLYDFYYYDEQLKNEADWADDIDFSEITDEDRKDAELIAGIVERVFDENGSSDDPTWIEADEVIITKTDYDHLVALVNKAEAGNKELNLSQCLELV